MLGTQSQSDSQIVVRSRDHPEEFATLFDRHAPTIHRYVHRRLGPETAEDLVADTFLIAFQKRHRYDPAYADARPWLFGIVTKLIAKHRRSEAARYRALARTPVEETDSPADRVADAAGAALALTLTGLNQGERDVLLLIAWAQLSYEETAEALGTPIGTVRSRLSRARQKMRAALPPEVAHGL